LRGLQINPQMLSIWQWKLGARINAVGHGFIYIKHHSSSGGDTVMVNKVIAIEFNISINFSISQFSF